MPFLTIPLEWPHDLIAWRGLHSFQPHLSTAWVVCLMVHVCLESGCTYNICAPDWFLHGNPKLRPVQMENHLPIYRGGFRLVSIVPPYFLVTLGDIPQQFLLQESPRAALRRFRRFLHWACHKDRMGGQVHCICVRFFLASFCVLLGTRFMFKIWYLHSEHLFQKVNLFTLHRTAVLEDLISPGAKAPPPPPEVAGDQKVLTGFRYRTWSNSELTLGQGVLYDNSLTSTHKVELGSDLG